MPMLAGDNTLPANSLAKAIYDELGNEFGDPPTPEQETNRSRFAAAIAKAVISHLEDNADIRITDADGGLQRSTSAGTATDPPASDVVLSGALE